VPLRSLPRFLFTARFIQILPRLPQFVKLYWRLYRDPRVSRIAKGLLVVTAAYVVSPIDLVPWFIPFFGQVDDFAIAAAGLWLFVRLCPPSVVRERVQQIASEGR
jgi:uncharacterized membrane protein YkvA (DUF1232 family)